MWRVVPVPYYLSRCFSVSSSWHVTKARELWQGPSNRRNKRPERFTTGIVAILTGVSEAVSFRHTNLYGKMRPRNVTVRTCDASMSCMLCASRTRVLGSEISILYMGPFVVKCGREEWGFVDEMMYCWLEHARSCFGSMFTGFGGRNYWIGCNREVIDYCFHDWERLKC